ncbi:cytochrome c oxidase subunit II [Sphingomonas naphthae]|uniref:Cytochrome c oxidase subunit 2 n=1 Tax=Sphingomonas naphthae TaxID=1813468 RepID=A0ABY7TNK5_9SPHN|nr:cytochrome c oxidase subunit II [Sphingomonas naphthae]WCT73434.1 cytochrome c oxidase subunit II [Sphingomonas naphthae]
MGRLKTIFVGLGLGLMGLAATPAPGLAAVPAPVVQSGAADGVGPASPAAPTPAPAAFPKLAPEPGIGMPTDQIHIQPQVTELGQEALWMHNWILMPVMTAMCILVLVLLGYVAIRFRASANPVPSKTSHNTMIEVIWTLFPVLILLGIALPSIQLLARQYSPPKADITIKAIGNQWYWTYQYPDNGDFEIVSNMLGEDKRTPADGPRLLAVDERMVVPAGAVVKIITTSNDVIHSFAVPAFWVKEDAVPGRLNETWFKVDKPGVYFGQCSELCGARHGFMPIAVEVLPKAQFAAWVASKGGTMPGAKPVANPDATSPASPAVAGSTATPAPAPAAVPATTATPPASTQGATANEGA